MINSAESTRRATKKGLEIFGKLRGTEALCDFYLYHREQYLLPFGKRTGFLPEMEKFIAERAVKRIMWGAEKLHSKATLVKNLVAIADKYESKFGEPLKEAYAKEEAAIRQRAKSKKEKIAKQSARYTTEMASWAARKLGNQRLKSPELLQKKYIAKFDEDVEVAYINHLHAEALTAHQLIFSTP